MSWVAASSWECARVDVTQRYIIETIRNVPHTRTKCPLALVTCRFPNIRSVIWLPFPLVVASFAIRQLPMKCQHRKQFQEIKLIIFLCEGFGVTNNCTLWIKNILLIVFVGARCSREEASQRRNKRVDVKYWEHKRLLNHLIAWKRLRILWIARSSFGSFAMLSDNEVSSGKMFANISRSVFTCRS